MTLRPRIEFGSLDLTDSPYLWGWDSDLGAPQVISEVASSLVDGDLLSSTRRGNRSVKFTVYIEGDDLSALAEAERRLVLECEKPVNRLVLSPGDGLSSPAVFETFAAQLTFVRDSDAELQLLRRYELEIPARPFVKSAVSSVFSLPVAPASPTTVTVSNADSTTGWTQQTEAGGSSAASAGSGYVTGAAGSSLVFTPAAPVAMGVTRFLKVVWSVSPYSAANRLRGFADGVEMRAVASTALSGGGFATWFECLDSSVAVFRFKLVDAAVALQVFDVERSDNPPLVGSAKQRLVSLPIQGSARTEGSIAISGATGLGDVQVFTFRDYGDGYAPPLSPFMGARITNTGAVSGGSRDAGFGVATVPVASFRPGAYLAVARVRAGFTLRSVTVSAGGQTVTSPRLETPVAADTWAVFAAGVLHVPDHDPGSSLSWTVDLSVTSGADSSSTAATVDEIWLYRMGEGSALSRINLGTGTPAVGGVSNRLWLDTSSLERPFPSLWRGTLADRSDARPALADSAAWGTFHDLTPPATALFVVASGAAPVVSGEYTAAWHTHAGRLR